MVGRIAVTTLALVALTYGLHLGAQEKGSDIPPKPGTTLPKEDLTLKEQILSRQYQEFEQQLLRLKQRMERSTKQEDRDRALVLDRVLEYCKEKSISLKFEQMIDVLKSKDLNSLEELKGAFSRSANIADELKIIISMLREDTRASILAKERERLEKILKDLDVVIQQQKIVQAQTETGKTDPKELKNNQQSVTDKTADIAKALDPNSTGDGKDPKGNQKSQGKNGDKAGEAKDDGEKNAGNAQAKDGGDGQDPKGNAKGNEGKEGDPNGGGKEGKEGKEGGDSQAKGGKEGDGKEGSAKEGKGSDGKDGGAQAKEGGKDGKDGDGKAGSAKAGGDPKGGDPKKAGDPAQAKNGGDPKAGDPKAGGGDPKAGQAKAGDPKGGDPKGGQAKEGGKAGEAGESGQAKAGESGKGGDPKGGKQGQAKAGESSQGQSQAKGSEGGEGPKGQPQQSPPQASNKGDGGKKGPQQAKNDDTPPNGKKQVEDGNYKQNQAGDEIQKKNNEGAAEKQEAAIRDLEKAKKELEKLLRQIREEELERLLAALQARCEKMLAMQIEVYDGTKTVEGLVQKNDDKQPTRANKQESLKLSDKEGDIVLEASKAIEILEAEGSAVAFPEVFQQVREDMKHVQRRLNLSDSGVVTQAIEEDIIASLKEMIDALKKKQQEMKDGKPKEGQPGPPPPNQDQKLLDKIAELKMIRAMQVRVNTRTQTYGKMYQGEQALQPEVRRELHNLSERQERIFEVTNRMAKGDNR